jgi:hypothetical protein
MMKDNAKSKWSLCGRVLLVLMVLSVFMVCAMVLWVFLRNWRQLEALDRGLAITSTESRMYFLSLGIQVIVDESRKQPPENINSLPDFVVKNCPSYTKGILSETYCFDPNRRAFLDDWHNPIHLVAESAHHYRLISPGPNEEYENGEGDDIVQEFDPWEFARLADANEPNNPSSTN